MSDALPLPPRPDLDQYRRLARDLQRAASSSDPGAVGRWAERWLERLAQLRGDTAAADAADPGAAIARAHGFGSWPAFVAHLEALRDDASPSAARL